MLHCRYAHTAEAGGYPDFIQDPNDEAIYIVETQKSITRIHRVDDKLLAGLFNQFNASELTPGPMLARALAFWSLGLFFALTRCILSFNRIGFSWPFNHLDTIYVGASFVPPPPSPPTYTHTYTPTPTHPTHTLHDTLTHPRASTHPCMCCLFVT
jgi:hypothetical protein